MDNIRHTLTLGVTLGFLAGLHLPATAEAQEEEPPPPEAERPPAPGDQPAQEPEPADRPEQAVPDAKLQKLLSRMHRGNRLEIRLGELAREKGQWKKVRAFGDRMVRDHRMGDGMVTALARDRGIALASPELALEGEPEPGAEPGPMYRAGEPAENVEGKLEDVGDKPDSALAGGADTVGEGERMEKAARPPDETRPEVTPARLPAGEAEAEPETKDYESAKKAEEEGKAGEDEKIRPPAEERTGERLHAGERTAEGPAGQPPAGRSTVGQPEPSPEQVARKLEQASPEQFDGMYLQAMVEMHDRMLNELGTAFEGLPEGTEAHGLLEDLIPILEQHRELAQALVEDLPEVKEGVEAGGPAEEPRLEEPRLEEPEPEEEVPPSGPQEEEPEPPAPR